MNPPRPLHIRERNLARQRQQLSSMMPSMAGNIDNVLAANDRYRAEIDELQREVSFSESIIQTQGRKIRDLRIKLSKFTESNAQLHGRISDLLLEKEEDENYISLLRRELNRLTSFDRGDFAGQLNSMIERRIDEIRAVINQQESSLEAFYM